MKKHRFDLLILLLFVFIGLFLYFYTPKSVVLLDQRISQSNPNNLDEERIKLACDFEEFLLSGMPKDPGASPKSYLYWVGGQRKLLDLRIKQAISEIKNSQVKAGKIRVWSLINMGVVVKTNSKIVAFDVADLPFSRAHKEIAKLADVILVTHSDSDHYDPSLLKKAVNEGKSVVFPEGFGFVHGDGSGIYKLKSGETVNIDGVKVTAFQTDHRGDGNFMEPNAWYLVEAGGFKLLHTGDGRDFKNKTERDLLNQRRDIDIFLVNIMIHSFDIRDIKPKVMVPLHLYKFMHSREQLEESTFDYVINMYNEYDKDLKGIDRILLLAGESFEYPF